jgi:hypothetical protein
VNDALCAIGSVLVILVAFVALCDVWSYYVGKGLRRYDAARIMRPRLSTRMEAMLDWWAVQRHRLGRWIANEEADR